MEKMRAMVLSECAKIETKPLKSTKIDKHEIKESDEILLTESPQTGGGLKALVRRLILK